MGASAFGVVHDLSDVSKWDYAGGGWGAAGEINRTKAPKGGWGGTGAPVKAAKTAKVARTATKARTGMRLGKLVARVA